MIIAALLALAGAGPTEWIAQASLPEFVEAHREESPNGMIVEQVPRGETVERWTRITTVQRFTGAAQRLGPQDLIANMIRGLAGGCPGAVTSPVRTLSVSGRPAARFRADCPRNPATGQPETFIALAIAGATDMHVAQVAFRRMPSDADIAWGDRQIDSVRLCTAASREGVCRAG